MYQHILVPVDSTDPSVDLVARAVNFAAATKARVTFLHTAHAPSTSGPADAHGAIGALAKAEAAARAWGVPCESMQTVDDDYATAVLMAALHQGCDLVMVASPRNRTAAGMSPSLETIGVLQRSDLSVLVAATTGVQPLPIAVMRDEHRSLAAVLHAWNRAIAAAGTAGVTPPLGLMRSILEFIGRLRRRHIPKEQHLFLRLRTLSSAVNPDLDELERQHEREDLLLADLAQKVQALEPGSGDQDQADARRTLEDSVAGYTRFIWDHVGRMDTVILPAARRFLKDADWSELNRVFSGSDAEGAEGGRDKEFRRLLAQIVDGAAALALEIQPS